MARSSAESETFEIKRELEWSSEGKQFDLLKTIAAFANCDGGQILLVSFTGDERRLDSARLDDFVNKYVSPPIHEITSLHRDDNSWMISVSKSAFAPHVIINTGNYRISNKEKPAFYPGQVYVRHSSKTEPANASDFQRMIREGVSSWLSSLGAAVAKVGLIGTKSDEGVPMRIVEGGPALTISFAESHPYSASDLGRPLGKTGAWIGKLINKEGMRGDIRYTKKIGIYASPICSFSDAAKCKIEEILTENPDYNPYH